MSARRVQKVGPNPIQIRMALEDEYRDVHAFMEENADDNIRKRTPDEVRKMIINGSFFIAERRLWRIGAGLEIVGMIYLAESDHLLELGGAIVKKAYRKRGLFRWLATVAITEHYAWNLGTAAPVFGAVRTKHLGPRSGLSELGFELVEKRRKLDLKGYGGIEHMNPDYGTIILADIYVFPLHQRLSLALRLREFQGILVGTNGTKMKAEIKIPLVETPGALDSYIAWLVKDLRAHRDVLEASREKLESLGYPDLLSYLKKLSL